MTFDDFIVVKWLYAIIVKQLHESKNKTGGFVCYRK